jgi:hypothetical protein
MAHGNDSSQMSALQGFERVVKIGKAKRGRRTTSSATASAFMSIEWALAYCFTRRLLTTALSALYTRSTYMPAATPLRLTLACGAATLF